ncbi:hypothetical protein [Alcaligenes endophyticus]|uniref:Uncharacterized protein n=1 Tax=Alcaligenes endophyticus TaxID=1929088 RepID=A0ABT8EIR8_9BURK|nr:hypothetical protein [Alcaligenes endophyticus]MCX5592451.1 hypothetical protein [Alcaligenes endophyticus]MDN4121176.1 hypothetical protein [Alcaligenes endophyticus]
MTESEIRYAQLRAEVHGLREILTFVLAELKGQTNEQVNQVGSFLDHSSDYFAKTLETIIEQAEQAEKPTVEAIAGLSVQAYKNNMEFIKRAFITLAAAQRAEKAQNDLGI